MLPMIRCLDCSPKTLTAFPLVLATGSSGCPPCPVHPPCARSVTEARRAVVTACTLGGWISLMVLDAGCLPTAIHIMVLCSNF